MDEIAKNLFLGDIEDARTAPSDMVRICVLENCYIGRSGKESFKGAIHIPILVTVPVEDDPESHWYAASKAQLTFAARVIDYYLRDDRRVLVHCWAGEERSPLTVAWYLHLSQHISMDEAYAIVLGKHLGAFRRDGDWLPPYKPKV